MGAQGGGGMRKTPTSNSWAKLMGRNQVSTISPKRRALPVVDYVSSAFDVKAKGGKGFQSKSPKQIAAIISQAIQAKSIVWISYNGHQKPFIPRAVKAVGWDKQSNKTTFFAVQHRSKSQNQQRFFLKHVVEVRDKQWRISNVELEALRKRLSNSQWTENVPPRDRTRANRNAKRGGGGSGQRAYANQQQQQQQSN